MGRSLCAAVFHIGDSLDLDPPEPAARHDVDRCGGAAVFRADGQAERHDLGRPAQHRELRLEPADVVGDAGRPHRVGAVSQPGKLLILAAHARRELRGAGDGERLGGQAQQLDAPRELRALTSLLDCVR